MRLAVACALLAVPGARADVLYLSTAFNATDYTPGTIPCCNTITQINNNGTLATAGISQTGATGTETVFATADLANGQLHVVNQGSITGGAPVNVNVTSQAVIGDTITASGPLNGFDLGVNLTIHGSAFSDAQNDYTLLVVEALPAGSFDQNYIYQNPLYAGFFVLGNDSFPGGTSDFGGLLSSGLYNTTNDLGNIPDGTNQVTLPVPFSTLGSNFELVIALDSYEFGATPSGDTWNNDYGDTVGVTLSTPSSVTLTSASNSFPGTTAAAAPEPATIGLLAAALAALAVCRRRVTNH